MLASCSSIIHLLLGSNRGCAISLPPRCLAVGESRNLAQTPPEDNRRSRSAAMETSATSRFFLQGARQFVELSTQRRRQFRKLGPVLPGRRLQGLRLLLDGGRQVRHAAPDAVRHPRQLL